MNKEAVILVAEDDDGHFELITRSLQHIGLYNNIVRFVDGQGVLDYFFSGVDKPGIDLNKEYVLLLDIAIPKTDGIKVLEQIKSDGSFNKMPVIVLTVSDEPTKIDRCHKLGCNMYIVKPSDYEEFSDTVEKIGQFLSVIEMPKIDDTE